MITLHLLGGVKYSIGKNKLLINKSESNIKEILKILQDQSKDKKVVSEKNVLITINGIDSSALHGEDMTIRTSDVVKIVTIVHGG